MKTYESAKMEVIDFEAMGIATDDLLNTSGEGGLTPGDGNDRT